MIEKPWYKKWWGVLFIIFGVLTLINIVTQQSQEKSRRSATQAPQVQQTPKRTDSEILAEIENRLNEYQRKLKGYYPNDDMLKTLSEDVVKLVILETGYTRPENETQKKTLAKAKLLRLRVEVLKRDVYAQTLERAMLDKGFNTEVRAKGANKQVLEYKYALMSKALAHKLSNEGRTLESAKNMGFTKVIFTDGFNSSWMYDLTKPN
ncbi:MAG: hypothetical protein PHR03_06530 [Desulfovibrionales bacterium]|nr:hypothetical protein [Desulfovibrionales bacterium]